MAPLGIGKKITTGISGYRVVMVGGQLSKIVVEASAVIEQYGGRGRHSRSEHEAE